MRGSHPSAWGVIVQRVGEARAARGFLEFEFLARTTDHTFVDLPVITHLLFCRDHIIQNKRRRC